ncbi:hypothetical protein [Actinocatenispora sera]|uniref:DUF3761 domain-containing protein n=1 Tax=Actinocatenispora sera TaxID=390989 RepID=A0A810KXL3_9ACTN|nr:hypothetical protein [Actinocatenispora sera]BCJ27933.1 hypothetical protein Asera_20410 [Actinocatenispora sera]
MANRRTATAVLVLAATAALSAGCGRHYQCPDGSHTDRRIVGKVPACHCVPDAKADRHGWWVNDPPCRKVSDTDTGH